MTTAPPDQATSSSVLVRLRLRLLHGRRTSWRCLVVEDDSRTGSPR